MSSTAYFGAPIAISNTVDIASGVCNAVYVGVGGDVALYSPGSTTSVTYKGLSAGQVLPVKAQRVLVTGTTATDLVALYD
jgi:hypothetical protein